MKLCVIGLGYIGLPTSVMFAIHDVDVHGVDVNKHVIETVRKGQLHIEERGLKEKLKTVIKNGKLTVSSTPKKADVFIICVPTPLDENKKTDLSHVKSAARSIVPFLEKGNLIILESTVPPKTTERILAPILETSGLKVGEDLFVAHSPERVLPGKMMQELVENDRVIGGIDERSALKTADVYKTFVKGHLYLTDAQTAELVKLIENTYRDVNIALANELALIAEKLNIDIWEAIRLANYHPRVNVHLPGPGVGGHCIAIDPWFIIEQAPEEAKLISLARRINEAVPSRVIEWIDRVVKDIEQPTITLFGLSYKANVDDTRESPALAIYKELLKKNYRVKIHDPFVKKKFPEQVDTIEKALEGSDCLVLLTDHDYYKHIELPSYQSLFKTKNIIDTRNLYAHVPLEQYGFSYYQLGTPRHPFAKKEEKR